MKLRFSDAMFRHFRLKTDKYSKGIKVDSVKSRMKTKKTSKDVKLNALKYDSMIFETFNILVVQN